MVSRGHRTAVTSGGSSAVSWGRGEKGDPTQLQRKGRAAPSWDLPSRPWPQGSLLGTQSEKARVLMPRTRGPTPGA